MRAISISSDSRMVKRAHLIRRWERGRCLRSWRCLSRSGRHGNHWRAGAMLPATEKHSDREALHTAEHVGRVCDLAGQLQVVNDLPDRDAKGMRVKEPLEFDPFSLPPRCFRKKVIIVGDKNSS